MKKKLILAFLLVSKLLLGQTQDYKKIYLDSLGHETTTENYKYYRIIKDYNLTKEKYEVTDYYKDGQIKCEKTCRNKEGYSQIGSEKEYYPSGKLKSHKNFNFDFEPYGAFYSLYENGHKAIEGDYVKLKTDAVEEHVVLRITSYWDENGMQKVIEGNGFMIDKDEYNIESARGKLENGLKTGIWTGFNSKHKLQFADQYHSGIFIGGVSKDADNIEFSYLEIDKQPEFKGGSLEFMKFIQKNYKTPDTNKDVKGRIFLEFTVNLEGNISGVKIVRGLDEKFDKEAVRMIYNSSNVGLWTPGEYRGKRVDIKYMLPIMIDVRNTSSFVNFK